MKNNRPLIIGVIVLLVVALISYAVVGTVATSKKTFNAYVATTNRIFDTLRKQVSLTQSSVNATQGELTTLKTYAQQLTTNINDSDLRLQSQIDSINQQISDMNSNLLSYQSSFQSSLDTLIGQMNGKISKTELDYFKGVVDNDVVIINKMQAELNSMQATVASLTSEIRGYGIHGKVKLIGAIDTTPITSSGANTLILVRFQCTQSGVLDLIRLRTTVYGGVKVAVYSDNASKPNVLLSYNSYDNMVSDGWSTISIPVVNLVVGQYYWLAYNSATACVGWAGGTTGTIWYRAFAYSSFTFPMVINSSTGYTADTRLCLISGWVGN